MSCTVCALTESLTRLHWKLVSRARTPVRQQYAAVAAEVNPHRRYMQSCNSQNSTAEPLSLADRIERIGRALTADELARMLTVAKVTIFKQAKAGRIPS